MKHLKIKLLRTFIESHDKKQAIQEIAEKTKAEVIQKIGFIVVLHKK